MTVKPFIIALLVLCVSLFAEAPAPVAAPDSVQGNVPVSTRSAVEVAADSDDDDDEVLKRTQEDFMEDFKEVVWTIMDYITYLTVTGNAEDWEAAAKQAFAEAKEMGANLSEADYGPINVEVTSIDPDKRSVSFKVTVR